MTTALSQEKNIKSNAMLAKTIWLLAVQEMSLSQQIYVVLLTRLKISDGLLLITSFHSGFIRYSISELNTYLTDKYLTPSSGFR